MVCISQAEDTPCLSEGHGGHGVTICSDKISQRETALQHRAAPEAEGSLKPDRFLQGFLNRESALPGNFVCQTRLNICCDNSLRSLI